MAVSIFPTSPAELTDEWLTNALHDAGAIDRARVISHEVKIIGEGVGFMGQLGKLNLTYDVSERGRARFADRQVSGGRAGEPRHRDVLPLLRAGGRASTARSPSGCSCGLRAATFTASNRQPAMCSCCWRTWRQPRSGIRLRAARRSTRAWRSGSWRAFHAEWWETPELYALDWMPNINVEWNIAAAEESYAQSWAAFCEFAGGYLTPRLRETGVRFGQSMRAIAGRISDAMPQTIVHGDYRLDNMFFASPAGGAEFSVIDWQIATRGGGVFDVAYFVAGTLPEDQRGAQERELVQLYHSTLIENGVTGYSMEACWDDYRRSILFMLVYSVVAAGSIDMSNPRGIDLFTKISRRTLRAIEELDADEFLE